MRSHYAVATVFVLLASTMAYLPRIVVAQAAACRGVARHRFLLRPSWRHGVRRIQQDTVESARGELDSLRRGVEEGYGKIDHFTMSCFGYAATAWHGKPKRSIYCGSMGYGFDRQTKRLAIFKDGRPEILVQDHHLFLYLWEDFSGSATYLEIVRPRSITWNDVDEAERVVIEQCPLAGYSRFDRCMVLPLLEGGTDRLFAGATRVLRQADTKEQVNVFELGHPQWKVMIGLPQPVARLDPAQYPRCFLVENGETNLAYAIDRSGLISAVAGTTSSEDVLTVPGSPVFVIKKNCGFVGPGQALISEKEPALEIPSNAKSIGIIDLKASCRERMKAEGVETFQSHLDQIENEWKDLLKNEVVLRAEMAACLSSGRNCEELARFRAELDETQASKNRYAYVAPRLRELIADLRKAESGSLK